MLRHVVSYLGFYHKLSFSKNGSILCNSLSFNSTASASLALIPCRFGFDVCPFKRSLTILTM